MLFMKYTCTSILLLTGYTGFCCTTCNPKIQEMIYNSTFFPNLLTMLSAFIVLAAVVALLAYISNRRHRGYVTTYPSAQVLNPVPLTTAAMVLGIGMGGFIDGIVLHQILQWHEMLTNKIAPVTVEAKSVNMFWDGIFHAFTLVVVFIGVILLWKLTRRPDTDRSGRILAGGLIAGWGLFNIIEGTINHHMLHLHNVREAGGTDFWNYAFLGVSVIMIIIGYLLLRRKKNIINP
jgi:LPXTG-motif cell wall-anchored protein